MKTQRIFLLSVFLLLSAGLFAQKLQFHHSIGVGATTAGTKGIIVEEHSPTGSITHFNLTLRQFGVVYFSRVDLVSWHNSSVSAGIPLMLGVGVSSNYHAVKQTFAGAETTIEGVHGAHFAFDIPLVIDYNHGLGSGGTSEKNKFGFYIGGGYGYTSSKINTSGGTLPYEDYNPLARAGIRLKSAGSHVYTFGFNLRFRPQKSDFNTYGLHILTDL